MGQCQSFRCYMEEGTTEGISVTTDEALIKNVPRQKTPKGSRSQTSSSPGLTEIEFLAATSSSWGVDFQISATKKMWTVQKVEPGQQFHSKGVKEGWKLKKVNDRRIDEKSWKQISSILLHEDNCTILFDSLSNIKRTSSDGASTDIMEELSRSIRFPSRSFTPVESNGDRNQTLHTYVPTIRSIGPDGSESSVERLDTYIPTEHTSDRFKNYQATIRKGRGEFSHLDSGTERWNTDQCISIRSMGTKHNEEKEKVESSESARSDEFDDMYLK